MIQKGSRTKTKNMVQKLCKIKRAIKKRKMILKLYYMTTWNKKEF